jgi:hypothetical protein
MNQQSRNEIAMAEVSYVKAMMARPVGVSRQDVMRELQLSRSAADLRLLKATKEVPHSMWQASTGRFAERRYFSSAEACAAYTRDPSAFRARAATANGDFSVAGERGHVIEGIGRPTFINPANSQARPGAMDAAELPSRRGNYLYYRDGSCRPVE